MSRSRAITGLCNCNTKATDAIANFITQSVVASSKGTAKDLRSYFTAVPSATMDTGDLYDSP